MGSYQRRSALPLLAISLTALLAACGAGVAPGPASTLPAVQPVTSNLKIQLEERFYPVTGLNARALNRALAQNGPRSGGRTAHAVTEWHLDWSYHPVREGAACSSARPVVRVEIVTTLPRWVDLPDASERLVSDWALFLARLRDHESTHQYLALEGGRELLERLQVLQAADCVQLEREAERVANSLEATYEEEHERFDLESEYGRKPTP